MNQFVVEHKTTVLDIGLGSSYWKRLTLDAQVSTYVSGARTLGFEPDGVLYDVARRPQQRPYKATPLEDRKYTKPSDKGCPECKKKKGATPAPHTVTTDAGDVECFEGRVVTYRGGELYANLRAADETVEEFALRVRADIAADPDKYFQRGTVVRLLSEEHDAAADTWTNARQIREAQLANRWPRNVDACETYGNMCFYWPVCSGETSIDDPTRYRDADAHEELAQVPVAVELADTKRHLPVVTSSSLRAFRACPRRYYYAYELRRRSIATTEALKFGTLFHLGLETWWKTADIDQALAAMAGEADPFERVKAMELMRAYHVRWIGEPIEVLAVEIEFEAPLVNPDTKAESRTFRRAGKIDAIARTAA